MIYLPSGPFVGTVYSTEQNANEPVVEGSEDDLPDELDEPDDGSDGRPGSHDLENPYLRDSGSEGSDPSGLTMQNLGAIGGRDRSMSFATVSSVMTFGVLYNTMKPSAVSKFVNNFVFTHTFFLFFSMIFLSFSEDRFLTDFPEIGNLWYFLFEVVSAYGNVGISMGVPNEAYSLSGRLTPLSKFVIMFVMVLGKSRGLPDKTDAVIDFEFERLRNASKLVDDGHSADPEHRKSLFDSVIDMAIELPKVLALKNLASGRHTIITGSDDDKTRVFVDSNNSLRTADVVEDQDNPLWTTAESAAPAAPSPPVATNSGLLTHSHHVHFTATPPPQQQHQQHPVEEPSPRRQSLADALRRSSLALETMPEENPAPISISHRGHHSASTPATPSYL